MPVTDAERLRAAGYVVKLANGEFPLVYDFAALLQLEQPLGGLAGITRVLLTWMEPGAPTKKANGKATPENHVKLEDLRAFMAAGLAHVPLTPDEVVRGFLLSEINSYLLAVTDAVNEAFLPATDGQGNGKGEGSSISNGQSSTTSPQSGTDVLTTSSGG